MHLIFMFPDVSMIPKSIAAHTAKYHFILVLWFDMPKSWALTKNYSLIFPCFSLAEEGERKTKGFMSWDKDQEETLEGQQAQI